MTSPGINFSPDYFSCIVFLPLPAKISGQLFKLPPLVFNLKELLYFDDAGEGCTLIKYICIANIIKVNDLTQLFTHLIIL